MIDLAIAAVVALFAILGWRRGLFRSLAELAAMGLALHAVHDRVHSPPAQIHHRCLRIADGREELRALQQLHGGGRHGSAYIRHLGVAVFALTGAAWHFARERG